MANPDPLKTYLKDLQQKLSTGDATEHTHRSTLEALLEAMEDNITAINEPKRIECGAPDLAVLKDGLMVGHIEAKDVGTPLDVAERSKQLTRYRRSLENLILTDYLAFRWYVNGEHRRTVRLARVGAGGEIKREKNGVQNLAGLLADFLAHSPEPITTPRDLAERMARLTHLTRDIIVTAFEKDRASDLLTDWRKAFAEVLVADLDAPGHVGQFADMFAQTLAYGLFSARIRHEGGDFTRQQAQYLIPKTNPFLRDFFTYITGPQLDDEPYAGLVEDLVQVLALADMYQILADFGKRTRQDDPTVHFYETFLAAYDPDLRERRGVYYTPNPVVSYIVRSVDALLKSTFGLPGGLADTTRLSDGTHRVLVLDPATGTATFLYHVINLIREDFMVSGNAGMWSGYVREHLLPRIFGFELLMAPYAVAHFKLALQLAGHDLPEAQRELWAYDFAEDERIQVYLTNTLEKTIEEPPRLIGPAKIVTREAQAANTVKQDAPIMVVIGNPPYSVSSSNKGEHIESLMDRYKRAVRDERNIQPLSDDYIKFIRFAHDRVERTGYGIVGMITNHSYLSGLIHRGMREELMKSFDAIYLFNLHGNALLGETAPDGGPDENVFDIRQGVAIAFFVKQQEGEGMAQVTYADLWGLRESKYHYLLESNVSVTDWQTIDPVPPYFFFVPKDFDLLGEYERGWSVTQAFGLYQRGTATRRDHFMVAFDRSELESKFSIFASDVTDEEISERFNVKRTKYWDLGKARSIVRQQENISQEIEQYAYRPFDTRYVVYIPELIERGDAAYRVMQHLLHPNKALLCFRRIRDEITHRVFVADKLLDKTILSPRDNVIAFPLYLYTTPEDTKGTLFATEEITREPNLSPKFIAAVKEKLNLGFVPDGKGDLRSTFGPEDIFHYAYAVFHSPTYRERYDEFLKIDFPRVPLTSDAALFWSLVELGAELVSLHLMEHPVLAQFITHYPIPGDNRVKRRGGYPKYTPPNADEGIGGRVWINKEQYFEGVPPEVWAFQIGGYQVLHKWLKDRRGRVLSFDELEHYQKVVVALRETMRLMEGIDETIPHWPME